MLRVFGVLCVASGFVPVTPRARGALFAAPTLNPVEEMVRKGQIAAYEAAAMVISLKISSKIAEKEETLPPGMVPIVQEFLRTYLQVVAVQCRDPMEKVDVLKQYLALVEDQLAEPFTFEPFHKAWTTENGAAVDHLVMDTAFMEPMLDREDTVLLGLDNFAKIQAQLAAGENVVLLSNHQTEADPSAWSFIMDPVDQNFAKNMILVAGDRVTTDPVAVPFSKGRNLLCIYSKRHIENPPELKAGKMRHNAKTLSAMLRLLKAGKQCIWVAPSGGRDRPDPETGKYVVAKFDPKSVEMFRLMAAKVAPATHFYPVAMLTHRLIPPPKTLVAGSLGEPRIAIRGSVSVNFGPELDFDSVTAAGCIADNFPDGCVDDREAARELGTALAHAEVAKAYEQLNADARTRGSPYYGKT